MGFIAIIHITGDHTPGAIDMTEAPLPTGAQWVGLFVYPPHPGKKGASCLGGCAKGRGWDRDRGGWMKCGGCGKRNPKVRRWLIKALFDLLGANLYPDAPAAFRTPEGYGNPSQ
jgi:hypothetical protein